VVVSVMPKVELTSGNGAQRELSGGASC